MSHAPKPPLPERSWEFLWDLLSPTERAHLLAAVGMPSDYRPRLGREITQRHQLEALDELARILPLPPGFTNLASWKRAVRGRIARKKGK